MSTMSLPSETEVSLCPSCDSTFTHSDLLPSATLSAELLEIVRSHRPHTATAAMHAVIATAPDELARYDKELERLDAIFERITAGRQVLQQLYDQCVSVVDAPVRRLPTEILAEIFHICAAQNSKSSSKEPIPAHLWESVAKRELRRVAGGDLVVLAQVCVGWRRVVLGTPTLWSTIMLDLRCWANPVDTYRAFRLHQTMVQLLRRALTLAEEVPLTIQVKGSGACDSSALQILAQTAPRWRAASFTLDCADLKNLSDVRGNLPLLETLTLQGLNEDPEILAEVAQYFSDAPRLRRLEYCGPLGVVARLPLQQLQSCGYGAVYHDDLPALLSTMGALSSAEEMHVEVNLAAVHRALPLDLVPVVSSIGEFELESMEDYGEDSRDALGALFAALTFPQMHQLKLFGMRDVYPYGPLFWPHSAALSLFQRSGSHQALRSLAIPDVVIAEAELLELLKELPGLVYVFVSDHPPLDPAPGSPPHLVVTDTLLKALTPTLDRPAECILPRLEIVDFRTLGRFTDDALRAFIRDRLNWRGRQAGFECAVLWLQGYPRPLGDETSSCFEKWKENGLQFACREFDPADDY
ncbi:hypothetical protein FB451DRAFT_1262194 [Mycena latifolia]|nr:hypothetical protein FB451DRAFT_1262194 [Mycena latifolia]